MYMLHAVWEVTSMYLQHCNWTSLSQIVTFQGSSKNDACWNSLSSAPFEITLNREPSLVPRLHTPCVWERGYREPRVSHGKQGWKGHGSTHVYLLTCTHVCNTVSSFHSIKQWLVITRCLKHLSIPSSMIRIVCDEHQQVQSTVTPSDELSGTVEGRKRKTEEKERVRVREPHAAIARV